MFNSGINLSLIRNKLIKTNNRQQTKNKTNTKKQKKKKKKTPIGRRRSNQETKDIKLTKALKKHKNKARDNQTTTRTKETKELAPKNKEPKSREAIIGPNLKPYKPELKTTPKNHKSINIKKKKRSISFFFLCS